jgi:hypothetical protein
MVTDPSKVTVNPDADDGSGIVVEDRPGSSILRMVGTDTVTVRHESVPCQGALRVP